MRIVANAFGERAVLKLMYAALIRASETWRGVQVNPFELKQLEAVGAELDAEHADHRALDVPVVDRGDRSGVGGRGGADRRGIAHGA